ncbi:MAG: carbohydrate kinase, partial [Anaerovoracaceae bacterium]
GECLIDITPCGSNQQGMQLFARNPGGAPANVLAMAAKLGAKTAFIGKVGTDDFGDFLQDTLEAEHIDCAALCRDHEIPTTLAFVQLDQRGERSFTFYRKPGADMMLSCEEIPTALLADCRIFHFGSVSMTDEPSRSATIYAVKKAREFGAFISFDPNYRPFLWKNPEQAKGKMIEMLPWTDMLKVNEDELFLLTNSRNVVEGARWLAEKGPSVVIVTLGKKGAYYRTSEGCDWVEPCTVQCVDATGAGDAFWGTILREISKQQTSSLCKLSQAKWQGIVQSANIAGGLTTQRIGAIPAMPTEEEIQRKANKKAQD